MMLAFESRFMCIWPLWVIHVIIIFLAGADGTLHDGLHDIHSYYATEVDANDLLRSIVLPEHWGTIKFDIPNNTQSLTSAILGVPDDVPMVTTSSMPNVVDLTQNTEQNISDPSVLMVSETVEVTTTPQQQPLERPKTDSERYLQERNRQDQYLAANGLRRHRVQGDGNCLYRAVSYSFYQTQDTHEQLRQRAISYMQDNLHVFANFFHPNANEDPLTFMLSELDGLARNGVYAGQESIVALSRVLQVNIRVTIGGSEDQQEVSTLEHGGGYPQRLHVIYSNGNHYDAVTESGNAASFDISPSDVTGDVLVLPDQAPVLDLVEQTLMPSHLRTDTNVDEHAAIQDKHDLMLPPLAVNSAKFESSDTNASTSNTAGEKSKSSTKHLNCDYCGLKFTRTNNVVRHMRSKHRNISVAVAGGKIACLAPLCSETFRTVDVMMDHLEHFHSADVTISKLSFQNLDDFRLWKEKEESENNVRFIKVRARHVGKQATRVQYVCNRSGKKKQYSCSNRSENKKGSAKIDTLCPARMFVSDRNNVVDVKYIQSHTHATDLSQNKYLRIPDTIRDNIKTKLVLGIPANNILDEIHGQIGNLTNRIDSNVKAHHLIDKTNIKTIQKRLVKVSNQRDENDAVSVGLRVSSLQENASCNPVLFYKPQFSQPSDKKCPLSKKDFMLVLMSKEQADMFDAFASRIVCMDSTHGTNMYDFKLVTMLIVDDYHHGYPVAFCITNREDEPALCVFLSSVKERCPNTDVSILMTDDDMSGVNAVRSVYGSQVQHFLCKWHILKSWDRKLKKISNNVHRDEVSGFLRCMLDANSKFEFESFLNTFRSRFQAIESDFVTYFEQYYANRHEKWALFTRPVDLQTEITTNNFLESFHKNLKYCYLSGKHNRRIDVLLDALIRIEKDCYINRQKLMLYYKPADVCTDKSDRHVSSLSIADSQVTMVNENTCHVLSSSSNGIFYTVHHLSDCCNLQSCFVRCNMFPCLNLCIHQYSCTCPDIGLCKHIHKVHTYYGQSDAPDTDVVHELCSTQLMEPKCTPSKGVRERVSIKSSLAQLESDIDDPALVGRLHVINMALQTLIADNKAYNQVHSTCSTQDMFPKLKIPGNKKPEKQRTFVSTKNKQPSRKKAFSLKAMTKEQKSELLSSAAGTVAPYPPLRLVRSHQQSHQPAQTPNNMFVTNNIIQIPSGYLMPPSMQNINIPIIGPDGKAASLLCSNDGARVENENDLL